MLTKLLAYLPQIRKAIVNALGLLAGLVTLGFLHGTALIDVNIVIAVLTAALHYSVPNAAKPTA